MAGFKRGGARGGFKKSFTNKRSSPDEDDSTPWGREGLRWALYYDVDDNGLKGRRKGRDMLEVTIRRRLQSAEEQLKQMEDANKKMQVKSRGDLKTQFTAPANDRKKKNAT